MTGFRLLCAPALLLVGCGTDTYRPLQPGDPAPRYVAPALNGDTVDLASLRGQPVLLNIWATWCAPCREEMPELQLLHERFANRGLRVLGASVDERGSLDAIRYFIDDLGISFTVLHDPAEAVSRLFRTNGVPETFLIDRHGRIAHRWIGRFPALSDDAVQRIEHALGR
jgi:cytochrome c biogenesis protein CcmG, thiol:disulfide interchange protein DsbE